MLERIKEGVKLLEKNKPLKVISHHDTDGITSAAIFSRALERAGYQFSLEIVKNLEENYIKNLPEDINLIFLDLGSGSLPLLAKKKNKVLILDHHEIPEGHAIPENVFMINPVIEKHENMAGSGLCYLFAKALSQHNKDLANLAVIGMIGDMMENNKSKLYEEIISDSETTIKKGLLLYPATRPLDRVLQGSFSMYIPEVTGSFKGTLELLREAGIEKNTRGYKSLAELSDEEMARLNTSIMLRRKNSSEGPEIVGNIYLIKFFNTLEDAREISATINACSRMDYPYVSLGLCLGNKEMKKEAEKVYIQYKKTISSALEQINELNPIKGKNYTIINARDKIKDTIIGTVASIMSFSPLYDQGTIIITMAYTEDKIKVSARLAGRKGRNVREVLYKAVSSLDINEVGGHPNAAGCLIPKEQEPLFLENLKNTLDIEMVKV